MQENEISVQDNPQQTETHSLQAMSFSEILDGMFSLYRKHFALFFRIVLVYFLLSYVVRHNHLYFHRGIYMYFLTYCWESIFWSVILCKLRRFFCTITTNAALHTLSRYFSLFVTL